MGGKPHTAAVGEGQGFWLEVARLVLCSRRLDELEERELTPQGLVKYQFSAKGHELAQVLLAKTLTHPHDAAAVYYRSRPFVLASGLSLEEALRSSLARKGSMSEGRDVGVMFNLPSRGGVTILPTAGDVGSQYAPAAGWAQAVRY
ncbi:MAG: thiamine pyrophosphate-dependent enzyme, partial [Thermoanaerobaculum sp.]